MKTLGQLQMGYKCSLNTQEAIKSAIKDYGNSMTAMIVIGRPEYNPSGRVAIETKREGVEAVEIYPGAEIGRGVFINVVVVGSYREVEDVMIDELLEDVA